MTDTWLQVFAIIPKEANEIVAPRRSSNAGHPLREQAKPLSRSRSHRPVAHRPVPTGPRGQMEAFEVNKDVGKVGQFYRSAQ
jgi:hypothetical protein